MDVRRRDISLVRLAVVFVATLTWLAGVGPSPAATNAAPAVAALLAGENVITGSRTTKMPVRITRPVRLAKPLAGGSGVAISARGNGFVGFALVEAHNSDTIAIVGGRMGRVEGLPPIVMGLGGPDNTRTDLKIPPGDYDLFLITDVADAKVTLRLKGLSGRKTLRPDDPVLAQLRRPQPDYSSSVSPGAPKNLYSAGADGRTRGPGLVFDVLWQKRQANVDTVNIFCYYPSKPEPSHPAPYAPGCPASQERTMFVTNDGFVAPSPSQAVHYGGGFVRGYLGQGFSVTAVGVLEDLDYVALWLSFD